MVSQRHNSATEGTYSVMARRRKALRDSLTTERHFLFVTLHDFL